MVVQDAAEIIDSVPSKILSLTPNTIFLIASPLEGAVNIALDAPQEICLPKLSLSLQTPVLSITIGSVIP